MKRNFEVIWYDENEIHQAIKYIANKLNIYYKKQNNVLLIAIVEGSVVFAGHLLPLLNFGLEFKTASLSLYGKNLKISEKAIKVKFEMEKGLLEDKQIVILEDLIDTGNTLKIFKNFLLKSGAKDVKIATLFRKNIDARKVDIEPDWHGLDIPNEWVAGFGIDSRGKYRNCNFLGTLKPNKR